MINSAQACSFGCKQCDSLTNICLQCQNNFNLNTLTGYCIYKGCKSNLYYQVQDVINDGTCQAICDIGYQSDASTNLCANLGQCSLTYNLQTGISQVLEPISKIMSNDNYQFILVYSSYFNLQLLQTGRFIQTVPFLSNLNYVQYFNGSFYMFLLNKKLVRWSLESNIKEYFAFTIEGNIDKSSQINQISEQYTVLITFDQKSQKIYFTLLVNQSFLVDQHSSINIDYSINNSYFFLDNLIFSLDQSAVIQIKYIYANQNKDLIIENFSTSSLLCDNNIAGNYFQYVINYSPDQFFVVFQNSSYYSIVGRTSCQSFKVTSVIKKVFKLKSPKDQIYFILQLDSIIQILDQNLVKVTQIQNANTIIDTSALYISDQLMIVIIIDLQQQFQLFSFYLQTLKLEQTFSFQLKTIQATQLQLVQTNFNSINEIISFQIMAYNKYLQSFSFEITGSNIQLTNQYLLKPFQMVNNDMLQGIASMDSYENSNLATFSASNGQIMTWDYSQAMQPRLVTSTLIQNQTQMLQTQFLTANSVLLLSQSNILAFDIIHSQILNTWTFQNTNSKMVNKFIFSLNGISFLLYDSCFQAFDQMFQLIFKDCSSFLDDEIIQAKLDPSYYIVIQKPYIIKVFRINLTTKQLIEEGSFQSQIQIQIWKIKSLPSNYQQQNNIIFELPVFFTDQSFIIFNQKLITITSYLNIPISNAVDISFVYDDPYDNLYIVGGLSSSKSALKYSAYALFKNQTDVFQVVSQGGLDQLFPVYKYLNYNNQVAYSFKTSLVLSFLTAIQNYDFNVQNNYSFMNQISISQQIYMKTFQTIKQNDFFMYGDRNGLMTVDTVKVQYYQKVYQLSSAQIQQSDFILNIYQSLALQKYFIIKSNIVVLNLLTDEFIEQIDIQSSSVSPIQFFQIVNQQSIVCLKDNILYIKNYKTNKFYLYSEMAQVSGKIIDGNNIYLFGSSITTLSFDLKVQQNLNQQQLNNNFQECEIYLQSLICRQQSSLITIFDKNTLSIITSFNLISNSLNYQFKIDKSLQRLVFYDQDVEIYNFQGQFQLSLNINQKIEDLLILKNDISILFKKSIWIFDRKTLKNRGQIASPGDVDIAKLSYMPQLNHIVFYLENINLGQIFTISLDTLIYVMKFTSAYTFNQPSKPVAYRYDKDQNFFILLDETGSLYSIEYDNQFLVFQITKLLEYDNKSQYKILGFNLDFSNNNLFIYTQTQVFKLCYGDLNKPVIKLRTGRRRLYSKISSSQIQQNDINYNSFMIAGDQGLLYKYQNTVFEYYSQLPEEIQAMIYNKNQQLLIIALSQSFILYQNFNQDSLNIPNKQQNIYQKIDLNSKFLQFVCEDIYITQNRLIIHYDFSKKQIITTIQLNDSNLYVLQTFCSFVSEYAYLGLNNGDVILYNRKTYSQQVITLVQQQQGVTYNNLQISRLIETSTSLWVCYPTSYGIFRIQLSDFSYQQIIQYSSLKTFSQLKNLNLMIFDVDDKNGRLFLSFVGEYQLRVFDLQGNLIQYLSLPGMMYNKIRISQNFLLAYTTFHIMIYDKNSLQYIQRIRRNNYSDFIVEIQEVAAQYLLILTEIKYEMYKINSQLTESVLMDQIQLQNPMFMGIYVNGGEGQLSSNNKTIILQVLILSQNQMYEQRYNLVFEDIKQTNKVCSVDLQVNSFQDTTRIMNYIKPVQFSDRFQRSMIPLNDSSKNNQWSISLSENDITNINFSGTLNSVTQVQSIQTKKCQDNQDCQNLMIYQDSFLSYNKDIVQIRDFSFDFSNFFGDIQFSTSTNQVIFDNIKFNTQNITKTSLKFINMAQVVLNKINISNSFRDLSQQNNYQNDFLFYFENVTSVYLYNIIIDNHLQQNIGFQGLIGAKNVQSIVISDLLVTNSKISVLMNILQVQNLVINNLQILSCSQFSSQSNFYLLNMISVVNTAIQNMIIQNNLNLLFLFTTNIIEENGIQMKLQNDQIALSNLWVQNNLFESSSNKSLISIKNNYCQLLNSTYKFNQGNIKVNKTQQLNVYDSIFEFNKCLNGGALIIYSSQNSIVFSNTTFFKNYALASGGAIYLEDVSAQIKIDSRVKIYQNSALIGGGMRLFNTVLSYPQKLQQDYYDQIFGNSAEIYGNNFASFIQKGTIGVTTSSSINQNFNANKVEYNLISSDQMDGDSQKKYSEILQIFKFQSGGEISLFVKLIDSEGKFLNFSVEKYQKNDYPQQIMDELNLIKFKVSPITLDQNVIIGGINIITSQNFDEKNNRFIFNYLKITSKPNEITNLNIYSTSLTADTLLPIQLQISMRKCIIGEVVQLVTNNIYSCYSCPSGQYSLTDPTQDQFWFDQILNQQTNSQAKQDKNYKSECQKCPDSTYICQNSTIILKSGYWRSSKNSSEIIQCSNIFNACDDQDETNRNGCLKGYIGPACRSCDRSGEVWDGERYQQSYYNQMKCNLCGPSKFIIIVIILAFILLTCYFFISTNIFMDSFTHSQTCQYLRKFRMIPISKYQIKDQSSFYLKILVNYIQISGLLVAFQQKIIPDIMQLLPSFLNDPNTELAISIDCLLNKLFSKQYSSVHTTQVLQALLPIFFLTILVFISIWLKFFKLFGFKSFHIYNLLNIIFIFFQPNQIKFFSKQLTCTRIGSQLYVSSDLTIKCGDYDYNMFTNAISIPLILIWSIFPLIILAYLRKRSKQLQMCFTLYYFGYYYQEYKEKFFYWEFIRIYLRVIIVVAFTLTSQSQLLSYQIAFSILSVYIMMNLYLRPITNKHLQKFDLSCYLMIIINSGLSTFNVQFKSPVMSITILILHFGFIILIILVILFFKINNPLTFLGRNFNKLLSFILPAYIYNKFYRNFKRSWKTFLLWKKVYKNLAIIIQSKALAQMSEEQQNQKNISEIIQKIQSQSPNQIYASGANISAMLLNQEKKLTKFKAINKISKNEKSSPSSPIYPNQIESNKNNIEESLDKLKEQKQSFPGIFFEDYETPFKMKQALDKQQSQNKFK